MAGVVAASVVGPVAVHRTVPPLQIDGPYARLLAESTDLGPARGAPVRLIAALNRPALPRWLISIPRAWGS